MCNTNKLIIDYKKGDEITQKVIVLRELFFNPNTGWGSYLVCEAHEIDKLFNINFVISGNTGFKLEEDKTYDVEGIVDEFKGKKQIKIKSVLESNPVNKVGFVGYLKTFDGLGKILSERIWEKYGEESLNMIKNNPKKVSKEILGLSLKRALKLSEDINKYSEKQNIIIQLLNYGVTNNEAEKMFNLYGAKILSYIKENPYLLINLVDLSFSQADKIAINMGTKINDSFRLQEGIVYMLEKISDFGHCYIEEDDFIPKAINFLSYKLDLIETYKLLKEHCNEQSFKYHLGNNFYDINVLELSNAYQLISNERSNKKREYLKYKVVEIETLDITNAILKLRQAKRVKVNSGKIYLKKIWDAENEIVENIYRLSEKKKLLDKDMVKKELDDLLLEKNIILEEEQYKACLDINSCIGGFFVLTGSAGRGKTFTLSIIHELNKRIKKKLENKNLKYKFLAPTGKASKVMKKSTGEKAETIHMGLRYEKGSFFYCKDNQFETDFVVCDESSMLNIFLTVDLLDAIKTGTKVLFMGDVQQLMAIGAGNLLKDLIDSNIIETFTLTVPKRQNKMGNINLNANRVIQQIPIESSKEKDFLFVTKDNDSDVLVSLVDSYLKALDEISGENIQILTPQKKGILGVNFLNHYIQEKVNKNNDSNKILKDKFNVNINGTVCEIQNYIKVGDKVINTKNKYDSEWYLKNKKGNYEKISDFTGITNGETGIVEEIKTVWQDDEEVKRVIVKFEEGYVFFDDKVIENLELAYAITVHKAQGSQWQCVLFPIVNSHFNLNKNLIYTAITRAVKYCFCFGQYNAMCRGINNLENVNRNTTIKEKLRMKFS